MIDLSRLAAALAVALAACVGWAVADLPADYPGVRDQALDRLDAAGVSNAATAVLLNFRAYDTFLEVAVLVLALAGGLALLTGSNDGEGGGGDVGGDSVLPPSSFNAAASPILHTTALARFPVLILPVAILLAGYVLWAGTSLAGGAFQAGAVLAAAVILLTLVQRPPLMLCGR